MKVCRRCDLHKEPCEFHRKTDSNDGLQVYCKVCMRTAYKQWQASAKGRDYNSRRRKQRIDEVSPLYARHLLAVAMNCSQTDVPSRLTAAKVLHIKLKRAIKEKSK